MDKELAARRLSAALGKKIDPDEVDWVHRDYVMLKSGESFGLSPGNTAYLGDGRYMRNGREWDPDTHVGPVQWDWPSG